MEARRCSVGACQNAPVDQVIVALRTTVGFANVCAPHGDAIRRGEFEARAFPSGRKAVGLEPVAPR